MNLPKYKAVKLDILYRINCGDFNQDNRLPSEHEIAAAYNISRITARKAFDELEHEGRVYREQGRGTFVRQHSPEEKPLRNHAGLRFTIEEQGFVASVKPVSKAIEVCDSAVAENLHISTGDSVLNYSRVYFANDTPVMYAMSAINYKLLPGIENYDFSFISFSDVLDNFYPLNYYKVQKKIYAQKASEAAMMLGTHSDTPVLLLTYLLLAEYHNSQIPVEQATIYARTDIPNFGFHVT